MHFGIRFKLLCVVLFICSTASIFAVKFEFAHVAGDLYSIKSIVYEDVYLNGNYSHSAEIMNKISVQVLSSDAKGKGNLKVDFYITEENSSTESAFILDNHFTSEFSRDKKGLFSGDMEDFYPVVRNIPMFEDRDYKIGDTWAIPGYEVHDFRYLGIPSPYRFPVNPSYSYKGEINLNGKKLHQIDIEYNVFHKPTGINSGTTVYPVLISGFSRQKLYWDIDAGMPYSYSEEFDLLFHLSDGNVVEYTGKASAEAEPSSRLNRAEFAGEINQFLKDRAVVDFSVRNKPEGIAIDLNNIRFMPDSAVLIQTELSKMQAVAELLKQYPDRDIRITGHTALAGDEEARMTLSLQRAAVVADYLIRMGVRTREEVLVEGKGAHEPVADNATEDGMKMNRRVEILILEN